MFAWKVTPWQDTNADGSAYTGSLADVNPVGEYLDAYRAGIDGVLSDFATTAVAARMPNRQYSASSFRFSQCRFSISIAVERAAITAFFPNSF